MTAVATDRDVRRITGRLGAEIIGGDVTADLDHQTVEFINQILLEHEALAFREVPLNGKMWPSSMRASAVWTSKLGDSEAGEFATGGGVLKSAFRCRLPG